MDSTSPGKPGNLSRHRLPGLDQKPCYSHCERKVVLSSNVPMDRTTDLESALSFVVRRIEEQANASGHPLNKEERTLLKNLPSPNANYANWASDDFRVLPRPRACGLPTEARKRGPTKVSV